MHGFNINVKLTHAFEEQRRIHISKVRIFLKVSHMQQENFVWYLDVLWIFVVVIFFPQRIPIIRLFRRKLLTSIPKLRRLTSGKLC